MQTAPASVSCPRKNWAGSSIASMPGTPTVCTRGQERCCTACARASSQQGEEYRGECCSTPQLPQHRGDGINPTGLGCSSHGLQVSAAELITGEFSGNSGLCASSITQTSRISMCQYFTFPSNTWMCKATLTLAVLVREQSPCTGKLGRCLQSQQLETEGSVYRGSASSRGRPGLQH